MQQIYTPAFHHIVRLGLSALAGLIIVLVAIQSANAAQLIMFDSPSCTVCKQFNREVPDYDKIKGADVFPIRRIDIHNGDRGALVLKQAVTMTPTFVFVEEGVEITRIVGYPGRKYFLQIIEAAAEGLREQKAKEANKQ